MEIGPCINALHTEGEGDGEGKGKRDGKKK